MGQVLHGSATTTDGQESRRALAKRYGINQKTVAKWKKRETVADRPTGPKKPKSTVLTIEGRGDRRRLAAAYVAAAGSLPLRPAADAPASDAVIPASLLTAT